MSGSRSSLDHDSLFADPVLRRKQLNRLRESVYLYDFESESHEHIMSKSMGLDSGVVKFFHYFADAALPALIAAEIFDNKLLYSLLLVMMLIHNISLDKGVKPEGLLILPWLIMPLHFLLQALDQGSFSEGAKLTHDYMARTPIFKSVKYVTQMKRDDFSHAPAQILELAKASSLKIFEKINIYWEKLPPSLQSSLLLSAFTLVLIFMHEHEILAAAAAEKIVLVAGFPLSFLDYAVRKYTETHGIFIAMLEEIENAYTLAETSIRNNRYSMFVSEKKNPAAILTEDFLPRPHL
jgi:hypothetical protein